MKDNIKIRYLNGFFALNIVLMSVFFTINDIFTSVNFTENNFLLTNGYYYLTFAKAYHVALGFAIFSLFMFDLLFVKCLFRKSFQKIETFLYEYAHILF